MNVTYPDVVVKEDNNGAGLGLLIGGIALIIFIVWAVRSCHDDMHSAFKESHGELGDYARAQAEKATLAVYIEKQNAEKLAALGQGLNSVANMVGLGFEKTRAVVIESNQYQTHLLQAEGVRTYDVVYPNPCNPCGHRDDNRGGNTTNIDYNTGIQTGVAVGRALALGKAA